MSLEKCGEEQAAAFRRRYRLGVQPLGDLVALIEQATGYDVAVLDAPSEAHGLTMRDPVRDVVFIGVARTRNPMRHRSTLAHELAHVIFDDWGVPEDVGARSAQEILADTFARHLLVPRQGLKEFLGERSELSEADLSAVVQHFLVSPAVAAIALHDGGYISRTTKEMWMSLSTPQLATRFGWTDQYVALQNESDKTRAPQQLLARAISGYSEGVVTAQTIATLRGVKVESVLDELDEAGIVPKRESAPWLAAGEIPQATVDFSDLDNNEVEKD